MERTGWQFWIDRGGTFTDIVGVDPAGQLHTHKLLSENPRFYADAVLQGMRDLLGCVDGAPLPLESISVVKMGTTVATNALLERAGTPTAWVTTRGFGDALRIGNQARPKLFVLDIELPEPLHAAVVEIDERVHASGQVLIPLDEVMARRALEGLRARGFDSVAVSLVHGYRFPDHEKRLGALAAELGFAQISLSHEVSPLMRFVPRSATTVVDAYLSPTLRRYVDRLREALQSDAGGPRLLFMQSSGGLVDAQHFRGKDALLSGPAGGVIGMVRTAEAAGYRHLIGFDMGGTSTDVCHYDGQLERTLEGSVADVPVRAPMMHVHTVAAGGGSRLHFDGARLRVGPDSGGADPGPRSYGKGGDLTITDCNVLLGKLRPEYFPKVFGASGKDPLDREAVVSAFEPLAQEVSTATGQAITPEGLAEGFLAIAVDNMARAIKKISIARGYDVSGYTLVCFGGAGGQHACLVADQLGMDRVLVHPLAGVLSALGIGLAELRDLQTIAVEETLSKDLWRTLEGRWSDMEARGAETLRAQGASGPLRLERRVHLRYFGSDASLEVRYASLPELLQAFEAQHQARFGFQTPDREVVLESLSLETIHTEAAPTPFRAQAGSELHPMGVFPVYVAGETQKVPFYRREALPPERWVPGPCVIVEETGTTVLEPGWQGLRSQAGDLVLERSTPRPQTERLATAADPIRLEIFHNLFMNIAEQMGAVLQNTAMSVNMKERLDFSCAVFNRRGELIANAPHIPVHLGSMGESVRTVMELHPQMRSGDAFALNAPYHGGTHLPDITVVKPVFAPDASEPAFFVACRGHHADIGGRVPGSAPADSTHVEEEGILLVDVPLVRNGVFCEAELRALLAAPPYPARNPDQNIGDLKAQLAACERGAAELLRTTEQFGLEVVHAYMEHVLDNAEATLRAVLANLSGGECTVASDDGYQVTVAVQVDRQTRSATVDFRGSSPEHPGNFNAPPAIAKACVMYAFRCLIDAEIPLNEGCLRPLTIILPESSWIAPHFPAAVFAGNVETSQLIVDALFGALGVAAASQGTMNNLLWGNDRYQYYETICGGAGATVRAPGQSAVQTHMTNSRLTDVEVLEFRYPVLLEAFSIRKGSGGAGAHRGGDGALRRVRFGEPMEVNILSNRRVHGPYGLQGGDPGEPGRNTWFPQDGPPQPLSGVAQFRARAGDVLEIQTPGGGGYGLPHPCRSPGHTAVVIERLRPKDWARLKELRLRALLDTPDAFGSTHAHEVAQDDAWWQDRLANQEVSTYLAVHAGRDLGMAVGARYQGKEGVLGLFGMWVAAEARGLGIGVQLVQTVIDQARQQGFAKVLLEVADDNAPAVALYARMGFFPNGVRGTLEAPREHILEHQRELRVGLGDR